MTGKDLIKWIQDNHYEDCIVLDQNVVCGAFTNSEDPSATYFIIKNKRTGLYHYVPPTSIKRIAFYLICSD